MDAPLLTVARCAEILGVSADFVRDRIRRGELRAVRSVGRGFRVRREWLDAFIRAREVVAEPGVEGEIRVPTPRRAAGIRPGAARPFASSGDAIRVLYPKREPNS